MSKCILILILLCTQKCSSDPSSKKAFLSFINLKFFMLYISILFFLTPNSSQIFLPSLIHLTFMFILSLKEASFCSRDHYKCLCMVNVQRATDHGIFSSHRYIQNTISAAKAQRTLWKRGQKDHKIKRTRMSAVRLCLLETTVILVIP